LARMYTLDFDEGFSDTRAFVRFYFILF